MNCMSVKQVSFPTSYIGNSATINTDRLTCESEVRADVVIAKENNIRLWGIIKDCDGNIVEHALVKLIEITESNCQRIYKGIAHTVSDCQGFYQFDLCSQNPCVKYKVVVGFANTGSEKEITINDCNPCCEESSKSSCQDNNALCYHDNCNSNKKNPSSCKCSQNLIY